MWGLALFYLFLKMFVWRLFDVRILYTSLVLKNNYHVPHWAFEHMPDYFGLMDESEGYGEFAVTGCLLVSSSPVSSLSVVVDSCNVAVIEYMDSIDKYLKAFLAKKGFKKARNGVTHPITYRFKTQAEYDAEHLEIGGCRAMYVNYRCPLCSQAGGK